jgi:hypothetical protein
LTATESASGATVSAGASSLAVPVRHVSYPLSLVPLTHEKSLLRVLVPVCCPRQNQAASEPPLATRLARP